MTIVDLSQLINPMSTEKYIVCLRNHNGHTILAVNNLTCRIYVNAWSDRLCSFLPKVQQLSLNTDAVHTSCWGQF